ncbi:hypothetical protein EB118_10955 [bacterium]|nr:hypothetical protein [bacterium]NDG30574.1 hypothetical protein [bacterium]
MKIGGFKTPQELEAYGEERFFTDFPEAKKLAMGGTPEAFPQIATADKFFSYGVPTPPTYYQEGGTTGPTYNFGPWYTSGMPNAQDSAVYKGVYTGYVNDPLFAASEYLHSLNTGVAPRTPSGEINEEGFRLYDLFNNAAIDALKDNPEAVRDATLKNTVNIVKKQGGATGLPNVFPQIQSDAQFFSPVYTNSKNAYKSGGSYKEAFPQAVSYPQAGWGKTNYFMLQTGGTFPPGMPQYTGMLPVMQNGAGLSGIDTRIEEDMNHYYSAYPMMAGGQPSLQEGGQGTENSDQSFYVNKMQNFISKLQKNGQKAIMKSIKTVDEVPPMSGMRYGGMPKYQSDEYSGEIDVTAVPGAIMLNPADPNYIDNYKAMARAHINESNLDSKPVATAPEAKKAAGTSGGVSTKVAPEAKPAAAPSKSKPAARSTEELNAEVEAEKKKQEEQHKQTEKDWSAEKDGQSGTAATSTTGTSGSSSAPAASGSTTTTTGTTNPTGWEGWTMHTLPDGRRIPMDSAGRLYMDIPYQAGPQYPYYNTTYPYYNNQPQQNYGNFLDYIPGGGLRRKSANLLLATAMANNDLSQYEIDPRSIKTRRAILPGNRIKSFDLVKKGTSSGPITSNLQTETAKTTQVPTIQDPNTFQSAIPPMTTEKKVQRVYDWNYRPNQPSYVPEVPVIGPEGPVKAPSMLSTDNTNSSAPVSFYSSPAANTEPVIINPIGSNVKGPVLSPSPYEGVEVNTGMTFDKNNPQHREAMLRGIMEGIKRYGGPYALPMFQSDMFSGENPFGGVEVNIAPNPIQDTYWNTGQVDQLAEQARMIEKENDPFKTNEDRLPVKFKRQGPFANWSADQMIAGMDTLAGIFNKYGNWNQENMDFNTAKQVYGVSNAPNSTGSYVLNPVAIGPSFDPRNYNSNLRGMYAQYGGQGFYTGDNYYLTMPTIKNVKKAGAFKPGK